jgi:hypothetical protein
MQKLMSAREIITALGGTRTVAGWCRVGRNVTTQWYRIGIPAKYWPELARRAASARATKYITLEAFERHTHPPETKKAAADARAEAA